jgi:hypothetical protein
MLLLSRLLRGDKNKRFKGFRGAIEIKHSIPGRIRFSIPSLLNENSACENLEKNLGKAQVIKEVRTNALVGSVLVIFEAEKIDEPTLTGVLVKLLGLEKEVENAPSSFVENELSEVFKSLNTSIVEYTNGMLDLNSFFTVTFLSLGVYSLFRSPRVMPSGLSMLYWAYMNTQRNKPKS